MWGSALLALHTRRWWACQKGQVCRTLGRSKWASFRSSAGRWRHQSTGGGYTYSPDREWSSAFSPAEKKQRKKHHSRWGPQEVVNIQDQWQTHRQKSLLKKKKKKKLSEVFNAVLQAQKGWVWWMSKERKFHCFGVRWEKRACTYTHNHTQLREWSLRQPQSWLSVRSLLTWQTTLVITDPPHPPPPTVEVKLPEWPVTLASAPAAGAHVRKQLHTQLSHQALEEPAGLGQTNTTTPKRKSQPQGNWKQQEQQNSKQLHMRNLPDTSETLWDLLLPPHFPDHAQAFPWLKMSKWSF